MKIQSGYYCRFFIIGDQGYKYFIQSDHRDIYEIRDAAYDTQTIAARHGLAPAVGDRADTVVDGEMFPGYYTEIVPQMCSIGDVKYIRPLILALHRVGIIANDVNVDNCGYLRENIVLFDFSCATLR